MGTKQLLAEIDRGINALQKVRAMCLESDAFEPRAKSIATRTPKLTKGPAKKASKSGISDEGRARIAAAQQKRWARVRREKKKAARAAKATLIVKDTK